jgi:hypothetical protein
VTKAGTTNDTVIQSIDWLPTILAMCNVPLPPSAHPDGIDVSPVFKGGSVPRDAIFCHFPHNTPASGQRPGASVRRGDWKLIRLFADNPDGSDKLELYNLKDDLGESKNLAAQNPQLVRELNALITGFLKDSDAVIPKLNPNYDPAKAPAARAGKGADTSRTPTLGWTQRQCVATAKDGALVVTGKGDGPFLGIGANTKGPGEVIVRARCAAGGDGKVEWLAGGKTPGEPESVPFKLTGGPDWQDVSVRLPADATIGILRVYLPAQRQEVAVQSIELKTAKKPKRWEFQ